MKTILLATDGSPSAQKATDVAVELAGSLGATLRVVSVWRRPVYEFAYVPVPYAPELDEAQRDGAARAAEYAMKIAKAAGVGATSEVRMGAAAEEICIAAAETTAEMIVLGAHGWGAMKRAFFGSVSTAVLHRASCPVLVVRADAEEPENQTVDVAIAHSRATFTAAEAREVGEKIGIDWETAPFDVEQLRVGMDVELEHGTHDLLTNVTDGDPVVTGKIALAHLNEFPDYYTRLARMEEEALLAGDPVG